MGSDPQSHLIAMHEAEHKACNERVKQLEDDLLASKAAHRTAWEMYQTEHSARVLAERDILALRQYPPLVQVRETLCPGLGYEREDDGTWDIGDHTVDSLIAEAGVVLLRLRQWVSDLQSGMRINCVYCGHDYGPKHSTPYTKAEILRQHIAACPEHPMNKLARAATAALDAYDFATAMGAQKQESIDVAMRKLRRALPPMAGKKPKE